MKILFLSDLLAYGGASKLIYDLLSRMPEEGYECELLILTDEHSKYISDLESQGITVHVVPQRSRDHFASVMYIKNWIQTGNYDIVHAHLFPTIYYCSVVKMILGKQCPPLVMTEHSTDNKRRHRKYLRPVEKLIYKNYNHVISISSKTQENLCKWLAVKGDDRFSVIENGIDVKSFKNAKALDRKSIYPDYQDGDILLLIVGSFTPQKNHKIFIDAFVELPPNFKLVLVGEGPLMEEIIKKVEEKRVESRIVFLGFRRDVAEIMHSVDMLVIPSLWEGFGLIAAEGMACGLPIAASNVPGLSEVVGDAGVKFDPNNIREIIAAILKLTEPQIRSALVERGDNRVFKYDINSTLKGYLKIYNQLLKGWTN